MLFSQHKVNLPILMWNRRQRRRWESQVERVELEVSRMGFQGSLDKTSKCQTVLNSSLRIPKGPYTWRMRYYVFMCILFVFTYISHLTSSTTKTHRFENFQKVVLYKYNIGEHKYYSMELNIVPYQ
jgi:hypothetical protein